MDNRTIVILGLLAAGLLLTSVQAIAPAVNVNWIRESNLSVGAATASDTTEGGNITVLNITVGNQSTFRWAGYLGNLSTDALIILANSAGTSIFYNWTWDTAEEGVVCAGQGTTYDWSNLTAATAAEIDTAWVFADASDDAEATFDDVAVSVVIHKTTVTPAFSADTGVSGGFSTSPAKDNTGGESDFLFCVNTVMAGGTGYDSSTVNYELIVPTTFGASETYYFYVEML